MDGIKTLKFDKTVKSLYSFLYSAFFPITVSAWAFLCYTLGLQTLGFFALITIAALIFVLLEDVTPIIPLVTSFILSIKSYAPLTSLPYIISYVFLFICIVIHYVRFPIRRVYLGKLFFALCLLSAALFLGGVLSAYAIHYLKGLITPVSVGPVVLIIYLVFLNGIKPPENVDVKVYLSISIVTATIFAGLELFFIYLADAYIYTTVQNFGWDSFNTLGSMALIAVPLCGYLMAKTGKVLTLFSVILFILASVVLCKSDGCLGIVLFSLPFVAICVFFNIYKKHRKKLCYTAFAVIFIVFLAGLIISLKVNADTVINYFLVHTYDSGRSNLFRLAMTLFKSNPMLGIGFGFNDESVYKTTAYAFNFHSIFSNVAATMGVFGLVAYFVYFLFRFRIIMEGRASFNVFVFLSFVMLESYGLIDVCEFIIFPLMAYMTLLILVAELNNKKTEDTRLPLFTYPVKF